MNENLYRLFDDVLISSFDIKNEGNKTVLELGDDAEYGNLETYSIFPGVILSNIDLAIDNVDEVFVEEKIDRRLLEINHCAEGRYSYAVGDDKIVYFGKGDLCISIYDLTKTLSDFPLGYYNGIEIFIDVDVASSKRMTFASLSKALAIEILCLWPPDNNFPFSPMTVSYPSGSF